MAVTTFAERYEKALHLTQADLAGLDTPTLGAIAQMLGTSGKTYDGQQAVLKRCWRRATHHKERGTDMPRMEQALYESMPFVVESTDAAWEKDLVEDVRSTRVCFVCHADVAPTPDADVVKCVDARCGFEQWRHEAPTRARAAQDCAAGGDPCAACSQSEN